MPAKILVTGGTGFIGRSLQRLLPPADWTVDAPGREQLDVRRPLQYSGPVDHVVHAAGLSGVQESWDGVPAFLASNVGGTVHALEFCRARSCSMTFLSTYVYGTAAPVPVAEKTPADPHTPYTLTKHLAEQCCAFYARSFGLSITVLRLFNVYGPGQSEKFLIPRVVAQVLDPSLAEIQVQLLSPRRDYVHISDVVSALALTAGRPGFSLYNVGSGVSHSVSDVIAMALRAAGVKKQVRGGDTERINEVQDVRADISRLQADVGWRPTVSLEAGIGGMVSVLGKK